MYSLGFLSKVILKVSILRIRRMTFCYAWKMWAWYSTLHPSNMTVMENITFVPIKTSVKARKLWRVQEPLESWFAKIRQRPTHRVCQVVSSNGLPRGLAMEPDVLLFWWADLSQILRWLRSSSCYKKTLAKSGMTMVIVTSWKWAWCVR